MFVAAFCAINIRLAQRIQNAPGCLTALGTRTPRVDLMVRSSCTSGRILSGSRGIPFPQRPCLTSRRPSLPVNPPRFHSAFAAMEIKVSTGSAAS
jgi:hypothetical protein